MKEGKLTSSRNTLKRRQKNLRVLKVRNSDHKPQGRQGLKVTFRIIVSLSPAQSVHFIEEIKPDLSRLFKKVAKCKVGR